MEKASEMERPVEKQATKTLFDSIALLQARAEELETLKDFTIHTRCKLLTPANAYQTKEHAPVLPDEIRENGSLVDIIDALTDRIRITTHEIGSYIEEISQTIGDQA